MIRRRTNAYVMSLTPFDKSGELDEAGFRKHLQRMAATGVGLYVGGSGSGEAHAFRDGEMERVLRIAKETISDNVPLFVNGFEPRSAKDIAGVRVLCTHPRL